MQNESKHNKELGSWGEEKACEYLINQGYDIIGRNVHISHLEIDIIAVKDKYIVFTEVKTRTYNKRNRESYGRPSKAINYKKLDNLYTAAVIYMKENPGNYDKKTFTQPCMDAIEISVSENNGVREIVEFNHIKNILRYRRTQNYYEDY